MPTPDPNNVLFKIAHPDLYERNPFNVLNLPVDATAKDIRRRKEDIEAAFDAGTETELFDDIIPRKYHHKTPSRAEVESLFSTIDDPENRLAWELFWFWETPEMKLQRSVRGSLTDNPNGRFSTERIQSWFKYVQEHERDEDLTIFVHNLAVAYHISALAGDGCLIDDPKIQTPLRRNTVWNYAIHCWNRSVADSNFWHLLVERVIGLNDPRIDNNTIRRFRDQFAFAFDQINVELAIDFAKSGREADAKRQVEYMKLSQPDSDDVEGTFDDAFAGLLRQTEAIVNTAREEAQKNPKEGLKKANDILTQTDEPLRVSRIVLEKGAPIRNSIVTAIFAGVRSCLIDYGNATKNWESCIKLGKQLLSIAETSSQVSLVNRDLQTLADNIEANSEVCGRCKQKFRVNDSSHSIAVPLVGNLKKGENDQSVRYSAKNLRIPICSSCLKRFAANKNLSYKNIPETITHPIVMDALIHGWRIGTNLSNEAVAEFLKEEEEREMQERLKSTTFSYTVVSGSGIQHFERKGGLVEENADASLFKTAFHVWCQKFEAVFPYLKKISQQDQIAIANLFFDSLHKSAQKPGDVLSVLKTIRETDSESIKGCKLGVHVHRPPNPLAQTYRNGYAFLADLYYQDAIYFNPYRATETIGKAFRSNPIISNAIHITLIPRETEFEGGCGAFFGLYLSKGRLFHFQKNTGCFRIKFAFDNLNPDNSNSATPLPFFQMQISQWIAGNPNCMTPIQIGKKCRDKLRGFFTRGELSANHIRTHFKSENEIVQFVSAVVAKLVKVMHEEIEMAGWSSSFESSEPKWPESLQGRSDGMTLDLL